MTTLLTDPAFEGRFGSPVVLAEGGLGVVLVAVDRALPGVCVLKLPRHGHDDTHRLLFQAEAAISARLSAYPHFVQVLSSGEVAGTPYLELRYYGGGTLAGMIDSGAEPARIAELLVPVLRALTYAHGAGIVHGDLNASQVLLDDDRQVSVLADLGAARILPGVSSLTAMPPPGAGGGDLTHFIDDRVLALFDRIERDVHRRLMMVTFSHVAPERIHRRVPDVIWDVHAAGVVLFRALTGAYPYQVAGVAGGDFRGWAAARLPSVEDGLRWSGRLGRPRHRSLEHVVDAIFGRRLTTAREVCDAVIWSLEEHRFLQRDAALAATRRHWIEAELARTSPLRPWRRRRLRAELSAARG